MTRHLVVDAGAFVAALNRRDRHHAWATEQLKEVDVPVFTCEAAIAEACHLLRALPGAPEALVDLVRDGLVLVPYRLEEEAASIGKLLRKYGNVPMSLADACLVRMAELTPRTEVLTVDGDFRIYRTSRGRPIRAVLPE